MNNMKQRNQVLMIGYTTEIAILCIAYTITAISSITSHEHTIEYYLIMAALYLVPYMISLMVYRRNKGSDMLKIIIAFGFLIGYTFMLFTLKSDLVFIYVLPILLLLIITNDVKLLTIWSLLTILINVIVIVYKIMGGAILEAQVQNYAIKIVCVIMATINSIVVVVISDKINRLQINEIEEKDNRQKEFIVRVQQVLDNANHEASEIAGDIEGLNNSTEEIVSNMEQVSSGSTTIAESVQEQLTVSEDIVKEISKTIESIENTKANVENVNKAVTSGKKTVEILSEHAKNVAVNTNTVNEKTEVLMQITLKQKEIIALISGIAEQTNLLALNASIEAARAGETGKGFAIVANSITELANKTQNAITSIDEMVANLQQEMGYLKTEIGSMNNMVTEQTDMVNNIYSQFGIINDNMGAVIADSNHVSSRITTVSSKNAKFTDSISSLSAISEEMEASAQQTLARSDENYEITKKILDAVNSLNSILSSIES